LDENVISRAKDYAQSHHISLSRLIESYLDSITMQKSENVKITPLVESLSGIIELPDDYDYKKDYADHLMEKYR
jgi:hypothetical protein